MHSIFGGMKRADTCKYVALLVLVLQNSAVVLTVRYSRMRKDVMYISSTAVVMSEIVKLVVASFLVGMEEGGLCGLGSKLYHDIVLKPADFAKLLVPAFLFTMQNNLLFVALSNLDAASFQVLYQLKILTTAVFSVVLLNRQLTCRQWLSLLVLIVGVSLVQTSGLKDGSTSSTAGRNGSTSLGFVCVLLASCSSGFAGTYFEKVLKDSEISVWVRNVELALIGIPVGVFGVWYTDGAAVREAGFFSGYSPLVWSVVGLQAVGGIAIALVVKYADSVLKNFSTSVSIVVSCLVSYVVFGETDLSPQFLAGVSLVMYSTFLYGTSSSGMCCLSEGGSFTPNKGVARKESNKVWSVACGAKQAASTRDDPLASVPFLESADKENRQRKDCESHGNKSNRVSASVA